MSKLGSTNIKEQEWRAIKLLGERGLKTIEIAFIMKRSTQSVSKILRGELDERFEKTKPVEKQYKLKVKDCYGEKVIWTEEEITALKESNPWVAGVFEIIEVEA